jgi:hypothetical protein
MRSAITTEELRNLELHHRANAARGNAHSYGNREELDKHYMKRQTDLADLIVEIIEARATADAQVVKSD